jgi:hypothetical protein
MLKNLLSKGGCVATRIFSNPCPKFRVITKGESAPHEAVQEQMIHEQITQEEDLEVSSNPYQQEDKINESWIISYEEKILEPKIEEFLGCLSPDPLCTQEYEDQFSKELHDMKTT